MESNYRQTSPKSTKIQTAVESTQERLSGLIRFALRRSWQAEPGECVNSSARRDRCRS